MFSITACNCETNGDGVYCERHGIYKSEHWVRLCRTRQSYFDAWEGGVGPGQKIARKPKTMPSLHRQAWNLVQSIATFMSDGFRLVDHDEYARRLTICDECEHRSGNRCAKCGCRLTLKAKGRAFKCPLVKWPDVPLLD